MNRQTLFNLIFAIFLYSIKNKLIHTHEIILLFNHISDYFYEEMYCLLFG
jgi:hypothetical protein